MKVEFCLKGVLDGQGKSDFKTLELGDGNQSLTNPFIEFFKELATFHLKLKQLN